MQGLLSLHLDKILFRKLDREMQRYQAFSKRQHDTRIAKGDNVPIRDVFSFLIEARDPETGSRKGIPFCLSAEIILRRGFWNVRTHRRS